MLFLSGHHRRPSWGPVLPRAPCQLGRWVSSLPSPLTLAFGPLLCRGHLRPSRPDVAPPLTRCPLQPGHPASPAPALPPPWHPRQAFPALRPAPASPTAPLLAQGWPWDPGRRHCPGPCRRRGTWAPTRWAGTGSCPGWPSDSRARPRHVLPGTHTHGVSTRTVGVASAAALGSGLRGPASRWPPPPPPQRQPLPLSFLVWVFLRLFLGPEVTLLSLFLGFSN